MKDVSINDGRTVLFVSHNLGAIRTLCNKGLYLKQGQVLSCGTIESVVDMYLKDGELRSASIELLDYSGNRSGNKAITFLSASITNSLGKLQQEYFIGDDLHFKLRINNNDGVKKSVIGVLVKTNDEIPILQILNKDAGYLIEHDNVVEEYRVIVNNISLFPGDYYVSLVIADGGAEVYDHVENCLTFTILEGGPRVNRPLPRHVGMFFISPKWEKVIL